MSEPALNPKYAPFTAFLRDAFTLGDTTQRMLCGAAAFAEIEPNVLHRGLAYPVWITPFGAAALTLSHELPERECRIKTTYFKPSQFMDNNGNLVEFDPSAVLKTPVRDGWFYAELPVGYLGVAVPPLAT